VKFNKFSEKRDIANISEEIKSITRARYNLNTNQAYRLKESILR